ncbi:MAG: hypothetical protein VKI83_06665 [Synechococcaceae cyanobacterium]|nr:hypothetical protein [Synechococcaceae cyanobacterium]
MSGPLRLLTLPLRAPMLLLLLVIAVYEGQTWSHWSQAGDPSLAGLRGSLWSIDLLHALLVVLVATMPAQLLRWASGLMAASRVMSLVLSLLIVTVGGLYLVHLKVLADVLILASAVLLARLDLARIRVVPPPWLQALGFSLLVLVGAGLGRWLAVR